MAVILLDHNVAREVAIVLRRAGHGAITAWDAGMSGAEDDEYLVTSSLRGWTIATHNRKDFTLLHRAWHRWSAAWGVSPEHGGILILTEAHPRTLAAELLSLLATDISLTNQLYRWSPTSGWIGE